MIKFLKNNNPSFFFIAAALLFEVLLTLTSPPLQAPDEFNHFYRAYQISEGHFLPVKRDNRLGGDMPKGLVDFVFQYKQCVYVKNYRLSYREIEESFKIDLDAGSRQFKDFANTAYYSPVSYLPQATILFVLRQFHAPPAILYYGTRWFVFLIWLLVMHLILKLLPTFKWLFTLLALLPMNLYIVNSFSADTVTNLLSFLLIALVLKHVFITPTITIKHLLALSFILILLAMAKVVYIGLIILLLLIPERKFRGRWQRLASLAVLMLIPCVLATLWSGIVMRFYVSGPQYPAAYIIEATVMPCSDFYAQKKYILSHGFYFLDVIYHTLFDHSRTYLCSYIGIFGHLSIIMPKWFYIAFYLIIPLVAVTEKNKFELGARQKWILLAAALATFVLLLLSQHLLWDCVGDSAMDLFQGRYLIPIFPLIFLTGSNFGTQVKFNPVYLLMASILVLNSYACISIYKDSFDGPEANIQEVYCNVEETDPQGRFKTSDPQVHLHEGGNITDTEHRHGRHSASLSPAAPFCFTYSFKNLHAGDVLEAEIWEKGEGAQLIFSGKQINCGEFYAGNTHPAGHDAQGWTRIKNIYEYQQNCDSMQMGFCIWNPGKTKVFVDDLRIKIVRCKKKKE